MIETNLMRLFISAFVCLGILPAAPAQEPIPSPRFPLELRAPENAQWTVKVSGKSGGQQEGADKTPSLSSLNIKKTGSIYHEVATVLNGKGWEKWVFLLEGRQFGLIRYADGSWERLPAVGVSLAATDFSKSDFEELQWMNEQTYKGVTGDESAKWFLFETNANKGPLTSWEASSYDFGAASEARRLGKTYGPDRQVLGYLSLDTLLPVKFDNGVEVREYTFAEAPTGRLTPPEPVVKELAAWIGEIRNRQR